MRRNATQRERLTPCQCCGWPLSERHHLLEVARFGENPYTVQLCANCHDLYHIIYAAYEWEHDMTKDPFKNRAAWLENAVRNYLAEQGRLRIIDQLYEYAQQSYSLKQRCGQLR